MAEELLLELRRLIDAVDEEIVACIARRHELAKTVGKYKEEHNLSVIDEDRELWLKDYHHALSCKYDISGEFIAKLFKLIISQSRQLQQQK